MIAISATGRLAHQPELKMLPGGGQVCEFRLLDSRFHKGHEITEAVTFFCFGEMAEEFCSTTVKGQEISATGTQETQSYTPKDGPAKLYVKYRLSWFHRGRKPFSGERAQGQGVQGDVGQARPRAQGQSGGPRPGLRPEGRQAPGSWNDDAGMGCERQEAHRSQASQGEDRDSHMSHSGYDSDAADDQGFLP